jgi:transposase-like protein
MDTATVNKAICAATAVANARDNPQLGYSAEVKALCVTMSLNGMGFRAIERVTGINHNSVINWVRQAAAAIPDENYEIPETAQLVGAACRRH